MTHAERIRHLRLALGMTLRDLSEQSGVAPETVRRAESGEGAVRPVVAARILETLERLVSEAGNDSPNRGPSVDLVVFGVLADYSSDMDWIDEVGAKMVAALRESGVLR